MFMSVEVTVGGAESVEKPGSGRRQAGKPETWLLITPEKKGVFCGNAVRFAVDNRMNDLCPPTPCGKHSPYFPHQRKNLWKTLWKLLKRVRRMRGSGIVEKEFRNLAGESAGDGAFGGAAVVSWGWGRNITALVRPSTVSQLR